MSDDNVENLTIRVLQGIRSDLRDLRGDLSDLRGDVGVLHGDMTGLRGDVGDLRVEVNVLRGEVGGLRGEVGGLRGDLNKLEQSTIAGFTGVHQRLERLDTRLEGIRDVAGAHWRDHEARISRLEERVGRD